MAMKIISQSQVGQDERIAALNALLSQQEAMKVTKRLPDAITTSLDTRTSLDRKISDWIPILSKECQVYVYGSLYLAKRFDQVHYTFTHLDEAKEILRDNLYAILKFKYFPQITDEVLKRINEIVGAVTVNLKTFLRRVVFEGEQNVSGAVVRKRISKSCVAFSNGIYDFAKDEFVLKYNRIYVESINNTIVLYDDYIVNWYFNFDFDPFPFKFSETSFEEFIDIMKQMDEAVGQNLCFELFYNMTHDENHKPSMPRMTHLSQILGYLIYPKFVQMFVMLLGSGQNGKNSLFDGCFSDKVVPKPVSNSIEEIETDRFITGSLEGACHNIYLETTPKAYTTLETLKGLTGTMEQTIQYKGINKYPGIINCRYLFAGNNRSQIRFSDVSNGFQRRMNLFEIYYTWSQDHRFMRHGDYYPADFSWDLHELKEDITNTMCFIYLAMYGVQSATKNFTRDFMFTFNEWSDAYSDIDLDLKEYFSDIVSVKDYFAHLGDEVFLDLDHRKYAFYDDACDKKLWDCQEMKRLGVFSFEGLVKYANGTSEIISINDDGEEVTYEENNMVLYLNSNDIFISLNYLNAMLKLHTGKHRSQRDFNEMFKKVFPNPKYSQNGKKDTCVKARLVQGRLRFVD